MAANRPPDSPYLAARQEWTERYGSYVQAARAWRIVGILGLSMAVIGFTYAMYLSTQVKLVPYIVEVDKLGTSVTAGFPQQIEYADPRDTAEKTAFLDGIYEAALAEIGK